jgi:hypothetical protein
MQTRLRLLLLVLAAVLILPAGGPSRAQQPGKETKDKLAWKPLFDGKTLAGWKSTNFGGEGEVAVKDGAILMPQGMDMTGITYSRDDFPRMDYEVALEGKKIKGNDFFCTTTFPVGKNYCSLVVGGWGGSVVGISSINSLDASENETTRNMSFKTDQWYKVRIRVMKDRIMAWIDSDKVVDVVTTDKKISTRVESSLSQPFGIATWNTTGAVRDIKVRLLNDEEKKAGDVKK